MNFFLKIACLFLWFFSSYVWAIPNPASSYCIKVGGQLSLQKRGDGGEYGICSFEDNRECEEWALFRKECPIGGVKITGYTSPSQVYCVIQGGTTIAVKPSEESKTPCIFPDGKKCSLQAFFYGQCQK